AVAPRTRGMGSLRFLSRASRPKRLVATAPGGSSTAPRGDAQRGALLPVLTGPGGRVEPQEAVMQGRAAGRARLLPSRGARIAAMPGTRSRGRTSGSAGALPSRWNCLQSVTLDSVLLTGGSSPALRLLYQGEEKRAALARLGLDPDPAAVACHRPLA